MNNYSFEIEVVEKSTYTVFVQAESVEEAHQKMAERDWNDDSWDQDCMISFDADETTAVLRGAYHKDFHNGTCLDHLPTCMLCGKTDFRSTMRLAYGRGFICRDHI